MKAKQEEQKQNKELLRKNLRGPEDRKKEQKFTFKICLAEIVIVGKKEKDNASSKVWIKCKV